MEKVTIETRDDVVAKVMVQEVEGCTSELIQRLRALPDNVNVEEVLVREVHTYSSISRWSFSKAVVSVVALAVMIATKGTAGEVAGGLAEMMGLSGTSATVATGATSAAMVATAQTAAVSLMQNEMNPVKAMGDVGKFIQSHRFLAVTLTAGATSGLTEYLGISAAPTTFTGHLPQQLLQEGVSATVNAAVLGERPDVVQSLLNVTAGVAQGMASNQLSAMRAKNLKEGQGGLDFASHKMAHGIVGAATRAVSVIGKDEATMARCALAGGVAAMAAETFVEMLAPEKPVMDMGLDEASFKAGYAQQLKDYQEAANRVAKLGKFVGGTAGILAAQDDPIAIQAAIQSAQTAVDHNFVLLVMFGVTTATTAWAAYDVHQAYAVGGVPAALRQLGIEVATVAVGGVAAKGACKVVYKVGGLAYPSLKSAINAALNKVPGLRMALGGLVEKLSESATAVSSKFTASTVGQATARAEARLIELEQQTARTFGGRGGTSIVERRVTSADEMKSCVREMENVSGTKVHEGARGKLVDAVRQNKYEKIAGDELKNHRNCFTKPARDRLMIEWERNTGQTWPKYERDLFSRSGKPLAYKGDPYQAHHIIPQQLRGPHEWWNIHPVHVQNHQGGVHGASSMLSKILKDIPGVK